MGKRKTTEQFIKEARETHGEKYDYSLVDYMNSRTNVDIICPAHGVFSQNPRSHTQKRTDCPKCSHIIQGNKVRTTVEDFIRKAEKLHSNKYDYSLVKQFESNRDFIDIICPVHGVFSQSVKCHLEKKGCKRCADEFYLVGKNEKVFFQPWLKEVVSDVVFQYRFEGLPYVVDAYIPELKLVIEFDEYDHRFNKDGDKIRQSVIEDMHGVWFYRIEDATFLNQKKEHESFLKKHLTYRKSCYN